MIVYIAMVLLSGIAIDLLLMRKLKLKNYPFTVIFSIFSIFLLHITFNENLMIIKGFLFSLVLIYAGYHDIKTRIIPDFVHVFIVLIALIEFSPFYSLAGAVLTPLPFLIVAIKKGGIGGGDVKLMAACGFMLGVYGDFLAAIIGLIVAVIVNLIISRKKNISFPLAPYLGLGAFISYLIS